MRVAELASVAGALLVALVPGGCGRDVALPDRLDGQQVGAMAERELEAENPSLASGTLDCPDLDLRAGASVRCLRTAELDEGRVVKVAGTVEVTSLRSGGRLHVTMDEDAEEFGVSAEHLADDVARRLHVAQRQVACAYLRARVGQRVVCRVDGGGPHHEVDVVVTSVDPRDYRTTYAVHPRRAPS